MKREERVKLFEQIEELRNSKVIAYVCGDRQNAQAQINEDAVRAMYDHVRRIGKVKKLDLFLYSNGGSVEVPWKLVSMLREYSEELGAIIPYRAYSATTLIALGCDGIAMGPKGELGPIDPAISLNIFGPNGVIQEQVRIEDIMAYVEFLRQKAGLSDQAALANNIHLIAEKLSPHVIGGIYRTHSHIRMLARKLLNSRNERLDEQRAAAIAETLAEKIFSHGHDIARKEATALGLPIEPPDDRLDELSWNLLEFYESKLDLRRPLDPETVLGQSSDEGTFDATIALIESRALCTANRGTFRIKRIRQTPQQVQTNVNLGVQLPPGIDQSLIPQQIVQQLMQQVQNDVPRIVQQQVRAQSPITGLQIIPNVFAWVDVTAETD